MKKVAITTYIDNNQDLITEFSWLYRSWLYSKSNEMSDIVAFIHPNIPMETLPENNGVIYIPIFPLSESNLDWTEYKFINSVWYLTTPEAAFLTKYKYILRTDNDCFLTPYFPKLKPRLATFGIGMFSTDPEVVAKLALISHKWGITPIFNNVGSTFMAFSDIALQYSQIQLEYCKKLRTEEFPDGYGTWPGWYFGVLTMYAGQLAANALFGYGLTLGGLDVHCMARTQMCETDYHIHAWHTYDYFSKFAWRNGDYKDFDIEKLDRNCIADYCLFIVEGT